ncbi:Ankyrin repeat-containing protein [Penicillium canescens]|uniref:Ankyrin repeat-containing protein n=1 Tax=Penicillium canescens TaxID=5083 RepID=A0AAD6N795_PENCN|nr:Ankyrin repeat-containing protein [Penicillium canescens]KAJ6020114.1 Ankyrin repeat-containing protein [Penicillium canescens]KAJ6038059.1 Ankyrin repeat-containing protein [Penicillium canescens]KAJ6045469.1 Ankyrin repeat-containing protein [Penicillium canescens]KAJ6061150.1 Ankyrin repeat-containing protein [Penicillium canescens]KAJ6090695.1 Ankyrin repeat-containing protein [Penicillium canescens]
MDNIAYKHNIVEAEEVQFDNRYYNSNPKEACKATLSSDTLKFIFTSRPYPTIQSQLRSLFRNLDSITIRDEHALNSILIRHDIDMFIDTKVDQMLAELRPGQDNDRERQKLRKDLTRNLKGRSIRSYTWASLVLADLQQSGHTDISRLRQYPNKVPTNLDESCTSSMPKSGLVFHTSMSLKSPLDSLSDSSFIEAISSSSWSDVLLASAESSATVSNSRWSSFFSSRFVNKANTSAAHPSCGPLEDR